MLGLNLSLTGLIALAIRGRGAFSADFLAAYPALTDVQDVGVEGDILNLMPIGAGTSTSTHADPILAIDYEGVYREFAANEPVWRGGRVVTNELLWSEDLTNAVWSKTLVTIQNNTNVTSTGSANERINQKFQILNGDSITFTFSIKLLSGVPSLPDSVTVDIYGVAATAQLLLGGVISGEYVIYTANAVATSSGQVTAQVTFNNEALVVDIIGAQFEITTGRAATATPSEYIPTTTAPVTEVFSTLNGNTVLANVVTEAQGADIADWWLQSNEAGTNSQTYSNDLTNAAFTATTTTVAKDEVGIDGVASGACTLTATGANSTVIAGAITAASANHVTKWFIKRKTGTGAIELTTDGGTTWQSITLTVDFDVLTVDQAAVINPSIGIRIVTSGDAVIVGNAEVHLDTTIEAVEALPPIITISSARTISATNYTHAQANFDVNNSATAMTFSAEGVAVDLLKIGATSLLSYDGANVALNDGVTSTSYAVADGERDIGVALGSDDGGATSFMQLTIDGVAETERTYDPLTAGLIDVNSTHYDFRSDIETSYSNAQTKVLAWVAE